jgi:hypothetical protein
VDPQNSIIGAAGQRILIPTGRLKAFWNRPRWVTLAVSPIP